MYCNTRHSKQGGSWSPTEPDGYAYGYTSLETITDTGSFVLKSVGFLAPTLAYSAYSVGMVELILKHVTGRDRSVTDALCPHLLGGTGKNQNQDGLCLG
jgi:hypothetical protein